MTLREKLMLDTIDQLSACNELALRIIQRNIAIISIHDEQSMEKMMLLFTASQQDLRQLLCEDILHQEAVDLIQYTN